MLKKHPLKSSKFFNTTGLLAISIFTAFSPNLLANEISNLAQAEYIAKPIAQLPALDAKLQQALDLAKQGNFSEAQASLEQYKSSHPKKADGQLVEGIILDMKGETAAAEAQFNNLIEQHPQQPEAYNNLAVLYAKHGRYEDAVAQLWKAFDTHSSYAQVYQNLSQVYSSMAARAYNRALSRNTEAAAPEMNWLSQTVNLTNPLDFVKQAAPPLCETPPIVNSADADQTNSDLSADKQPSKPLTIEALDDLNEEVMESIRGWLQAWSSQNLEDYFDSYIDQYRPNRRTSHERWVKTRTQRISKPKFISLEINKIVLKWVSADEVNVTFNQAYKADHYQDSTRKELTLLRSDSNWKIAKERSYSN